MQAAVDAFGRVDACELAVFYGTRRSTRWTMPRLMR